LWPCKGSKHSGSYRKLRIRDRYRTNELRYIIYVRRGGEKQGRMIKYITDEEGRKHDTHEAIMRTMTKTIKEGYKATLSDKKGVEVLRERIQSSVTQTQIGIWRVG
jgi:hypothetical protein